MISSSFQLRNSLIDCEFSSSQGFNKKLLTYPLPSTLLTILSASISPGVRRDSSAIFASRKCLFGQHCLDCPKKRRTDLRGKKCLWLWYVVTLFSRFGAFFPTCTSSHHNMLNALTNEGSASTKHLPFTHSAQRTSGIWPCTVPTAHFEVQLR